MTGTATRKAEEDCNNLDFFYSLTLLLRSSCIWIGYASGLPREDRMKRSIALWASLVIGFLAGSTGMGSAVVYCQYAGYPANCIVRPGVGVAPSHEPRRIPASMNARPSGLIRQDLFDRNNPNNLRSDGPTPPAQPRQYCKVALRRSHFETGRLMLTCRTCIALGSGRAHNMGSRAGYRRREP